MVQKEYQDFRLEKLFVIFTKKAKPRLSTVWTLSNLSSINRCFCYKPSKFFKFIIFLFNLFLIKKKYDYNVKICAQKCYL